MSPERIDRREQERQRAAALSHALQHDQSLRVLWLAVLRSLTRYHGRVIPVAADDQAALDELDARMADDVGGRLDAFVQDITAHAPEVVRGVPDPFLWLAYTALRYASGKYPDPLKPWGPRGRRQGTGHFLNGDQFCAAMLPLIRLLQKQGHPPTQERVARLWLGSFDRPFGRRPALDSAIHTLKRYCRKFGYHWADLVRDAHRT
jgi:hypothetical protein